MAAAGDGNHAEICHHPFEGGDCGRHRSVADDVEAGGHFGLGACSYVRFDAVYVKVAGADAVGGVRVGLVQPGGARPERPVDEQITGQPSSPGLGHQVTGLGRRGHGLTPVPDHLDSVLECTQPRPVVEPADFRTGAFVHGDDAGRGYGLQRHGPGVGKLDVGQEVACGGPG